MKSMIGFRNGKMPCDDYLTEVDLKAMNLTKNAQKQGSNFLLEIFDKIIISYIPKRWQVAIMANLGFLIIFGIRCNFGAAKSVMIDRGGFNWTHDELGIMESSFFYGYLMTQIPAGFLAAKFPANRIFGFAIGGTSLLNLLMPWAFKTRNNYVIVILQILQGLIQGFGYPSLHGVWNYWAPPLERSKLATTAVTGSYGGAVIGMPLSSFLAYYFSWSSPFYVYGILGIIWTIFWFSLIFEKPGLHPLISQEEKGYIETAIGYVSTDHLTLTTVPWKAIATSKPVYAIIVANFARSWSFYLLLQNQLTYMKDSLGMNVTKSGLLAALPHAVMGVVVLFGGQLADYLRSNQKVSTTTVRKIFNCGGFGAEAVFYLIVAYASDSTIALIALILAVGFSGFGISGYEVNHLDIAPRYAAILMGISNGIGTFAALICPIITEKLTETDVNIGWRTIFLLTSIIHFVGIIFYGVFASGNLQSWAEPKLEISRTSETSRNVWNYVP